MAELLQYNDPQSSLNTPKRRFERFTNKLGKRGLLGLSTLVFAMLMLPVVMIGVQNRTTVKQQAASVNNYDGCSEVVLQEGLAGKNQYGTYIQPLVFSRDNKINVYLIGDGGDYGRKPDAGTWFNMYRKIGTIDPITRGVRWSNWEFYGGNVSELLGWSLNFNLSGEWIFAKGMVYGTNQPNSNSYKLDTQDGVWRDTTEGDRIGNYPTTYVELYPNRYKFFIDNEGRMAGCRVDTPRPTTVNRPIQDPPLGICYFPDTCSQSEQRQKALACLSQSPFKVVNGYENGNFGPNDTIRRGSYVAFILRYHANVIKDWTLMTQAEVDALPNWDARYPDRVSVFTDVPRTHSLAREIYTSQKLGFIRGYGNGKFGPDDLWVYGFHGITRTDTFPGSEPYRFTGYDLKPDDADGITRIEFIEKMYTYAKQRNADKVTSCQ